MNRLIVGGLLVTFLVLFGSGCVAVDSSGNPSSALTGAMFFVTVFSTSGVWGVIGVLHARPKPTHTEVWISGGALLILLGAWAGSLLSPYKNMSADGFWFILGGALGGLVIWILVFTFSFMSVRERLLSLGVFLWGILGGVYLFLPAARSVTNTFPLFVDAALTIFSLIGSMALYLLLPARPLIKYMAMESRAHP